MELLPLGPVLFIDTAGVDDNQEILGELRADTTRKMLSRCDCALLVYQAGAWVNRKRSYLPPLPHKRFL